MKTQTKINAINKVNDLINLANELELEVIDTTSTWQTPIIYEPIKFDRGGYIIKYKELDLYRSLTTKGKLSKWKNCKDRVSANDPDWKGTLNYIAGMYKKVIKKEFNG